MTAAPDPFPGIVSEYKLVLLLQLEHNLLSCCLGNDVSAEICTTSSMGKDTEEPCYLLFL